MWGKHFKNEEELADTVDTLRGERDGGAKSAKIFGSRVVPGKWGEDSDIDILVEKDGVGAYGEVDFVQGGKSGTWIHVLRKEPSRKGGKSRREEILDTAEETGRKIF